MLARLLGCQKEKCNSYLTLWIGWVPSYEVFVICHLIHIFFSSKDKHTHMYIECYSLRVLQRHCNDIILLPNNAFSKKLTFSEILIFKKIVNAWYRN